MLVPFLELGIWAKVLPSVVRLEVICNAQLRSLLFSVDALMRVVDANSVVVNVLFFLSVREIREVLEEIDGFVGFSKKAEAGLGDLGPTCWRWGLEIGGLEMEMSDEEAVEVRHAGDDFVAVVWHDDESGKLYPANGRGKQ